jgi:WD40 repeat protein
VKSMTGHTHRSIPLSFSASNPLGFLLGSSDGTVRVWDVLASSGALIRPHFQCNDCKGRKSGARSSGTEAGGEDEDGQRTRWGSGGHRAKRRDDWIITQGFNNRKKEILPRTSPLLASGSWSPIRD